MTPRDHAVNAFHLSLCQPRRTLTILAALALPAAVLLAKRARG